MPYEPYERNLIRTRVKIAFTGKNVFHTVLDNKEDENYRVFCLAIGSLGGDSQGMTLLKQEEILKNW